MRLSSSQIEAIKQGHEHLFDAQAGVCMSGSCVADNQRGFTLVELIMVMVIVGILAVFVAPRYFDANIFKSKGFADQVQTSLRYAQKEAIARRSYVCVALAASSITLTRGATAACTDGALAFPTGGNVMNAPSGVTLSPAVSFNFDALGSTPAQQIISVSGAMNNIVVEAVTGYVHSP